MLWRWIYRRPFVTTSNTVSRSTTVSGNAYSTGLTTTVSNTNTITTTLRARFGYNAVSVSTTTTTVTQAPPLVNNAAPVAPGAPTNLYQLESAFAQPPVPRVTTTVSTTVSNTVAVAPRWRLVPVRRGRSTSWVWRIA
jgi:hypothetical protein